LNTFISSRIDLLYDKAKDINRFKFVLNIMIELQFKCCMTRTFQVFHARCLALFIMIFFATANNDQTLTA
jgi:hypothetical protein